jgi:hypothetical protein
MAGPATGFAPPDSVSDSGVTLAVACVPVAMMVVWWLWAAYGSVVVGVLHSNEFLQVRAMCDVLLSGWCACGGHGRGGCGGGGGGAGAGAGGAGAGGAGGGWWWWR